MSLGANIRAAREAALLSGQQLADRAGISRTWCNLIENGHVKPSGRVVCSIATALNVAPHDLLPTIKERPMSTKLSAELRSAADQLAASCRTGELNALDTASLASMIALSFSLAKWSDEAAEMEEAARPPTQRERATRLFGSAGPDATAS